MFDLKHKTIVQLGTKEENSYNISGFSYNLGILFNKKIQNNLNLYSSLNYRPKSKFKTNKTRNLSLIAFDNLGNEFQVTEPVEIEIPDENIVLPSKLSLGFGIGKTNKWMLGSEISFSKSSKQNNLFTENSNSTYKNSQRYTIGGYYIPKYDSFNSYLSRVVYRAGFRYDTNGLVINNQTINDYGMNFGLGLPLGVSKIDVGFEFGKRGTTSSGLIQENYFQP
jgi:long-subunit fatty acid transport protein